MDTKEVFVDFNIPYLLQVEDSLEGEGEPYLIGLDGIPAEIYFKKVPKGSSGISIAGQMIGDRLGNVSETAVRVHFDERLIQEIPEERIEKSPPDSVVYQSGSHNEDYRGFIVESAVAAVNRFLRVYKNVTVSYWMRNLLPYEIFSFKIKEFREDGEQKEVTYEYSNSPFEGFGSLIEEQQDDKIRHALKTEEEVPLDSEMELETINKISLGEYNLAVLNAQRLFEIWVKNTALTLLEQEYSEQRAEELMINDGEYVPMGQTFNYFDHHLDYDFTATDEHDRWRSAYKQIRCEVAHAEYIATNQEANEMYEACQSAQLVIYKEFEEELKGTRLELGERDVPKNSFSEDS